MANENTPRVGDGVTYHIGSDGYPMTVRKVSASGKTIWCSKDKFESDGKADWTDSYKTGTFIPQDADKPENWERFSLRKNGAWRPARSRNAGYLGKGRAYIQDPSF